MKTFSRRQLGFLALSSISVATVTACSGSQKTATPASSDEPTAKQITIQDNRGEVTLSIPPARIAATDNRIFRTLEQWSISLVAAPKPLLPAESSYKEDASVLDTGSHREPDLEQLVVANPDLVLNGQRFAQHYEDIKALLPNASLIDTDIDTSKDLFSELSRQIRLLGAVLEHESEAEELIGEFEKAVQRVKDAYNPDQTVMGVITTGGNVNYSAPKTGRAIGPLFPLLGLKPAIELEGSTDHQGDDISVEAVADSNPDWIIVMDRDAAVSAAQEAGYQPASELIDKSEALKNVSAIQNGNIVYMPNNFYVTEDIQAYTEFLNNFAKALAAKS